MVRDELKLQATLSRTAIIGATEANANLSSDAYPGVGKIVQGKLEVVIEHGDDWEEHGWEECITPTGSIWVNTWLNT